MMKKLLALVLVLAMAQTASAVTMQILVNGEPWTGDSVRPSDYITYSLHVTPLTLPQPIPLGSLITVDHGDLQTHWLHPGKGLGTWPVVTYPLGDGFSIGGSATWFPGTPGTDATGKAIEIVFHVPDDMQDSDYITITAVGAFGADRWEQIGDAVIHVVPEPTTIALLGLGGLCLLRRRRK
jgi:hypothetical protein